MGSSKGGSDAEYRPISSSAACDDGKRVVSGGYDHTMRLWDLQTGQELRRFQNHEQRVWCLAVTPDGQRILTGSNDGPARLWAVETGKELHQFDDRLHCASVAISPDGKRALVGGFDNT